LCWWAKKIIIIITISDAVQSSEVTGKSAQLNWYPTCAGNGSSETTYEHCITAAAIYNLGMGCAPFLLCSA